jgi:metal-sulfur cluster biosynthetic enzyme
MLTGFVSEELVRAALQDVIDPELGVNIVDLGLVYGVGVADDGQIDVTMTLTTPGCPLHASFAEEIERALRRSIPDLSGVSVALVWEPRWSPMMISDVGMEQLGLA